MSGNVISFEDLMGRKAAATKKAYAKNSSGMRPIGTKDLKRSISVSFEAHVEELRRRKEFLNNIIDGAADFMRQAKVTCGNLYQGPDMSMLLNDFDVAMNTMLNEQLTIIQADDDDIHYELCVTLPEGSEQTKEVNSVYVTLNRRKNGFFEQYNCENDEWCLEYIPKEGVLSEEAQNELKNRTQKGRFVYECVLSLDHEERISEKIDNLAVENAPLIRLLEDFPNDFDLYFADDGTISLIPYDPLKDGIAVRAENGKYALYQFLNEDVVACICNPEDFEEENEYDEYGLNEYEEYVRKVDVTEDYETVRRFVEAYCCEGDEFSDDFPDVVIPLSWEKAYGIILDDGVLNKIKYDLVQGGMKKEEKEALRAFRNDFREELKFYN